MNRFTPVSTWTNQDLKPRDVSNQFSSILNQLNTLDQNNFGGMVNVKDFGARGDNVADDTSAIQQAINTVSDGALFFPSGTYKISKTLTTVLGSNLIGTYVPGNYTGTSINQTASVPVFTLANSSQTGAEQQRCSISGFNLLNGTNSIYAPNGGVGVTIRNVMCTGPSNAGILWRGFIQEWFVYDFQCNNAAYGMYLSQAGVQQDGSTVGTPILFDKNHFYGGYINNTTNVGLYLSLGTRPGTLDTFTDYRFISCQQGAIVLQGGLNTITFVGLSTESNGTRSAPSPTTATTTAGSANVTVASGTGLTNGQTLTIKGAGTNGVDWYPVISSGGGTVNLVMTTTAPTTVTSQECVNYAYSEILLGGVGNAPAKITFIGFNVGQNPSVNGSCRYAIDASGGTYVVLLNGQTSRPIYDPNTSVLMLAENGTLTTRRQNNYLGEQFFTPTFGGDANAARTQIVSPPGANITLGAQDTNTNGTGTFGVLDARKVGVGFPVDAPQVWKVDYTTGQESNLGGLMPGNFGAGTGALTSFAMGGLRVCYGNAIPTAGTWSRGERIFANGASVGSPKGWICTVSGTPGTWVSEGNL